MRPHRRSEGWDSYEGEALAETPPVRSALTRAPSVFPAIVFGPDHAWSETIPRTELCLYLSVATRDGRWWRLGLDDTVKAIVDLDGDDLRGMLAGQPDVVEAEHTERAGFEVVLARTLRADEMLARFIDALAAAHRAQAQRRGISLPQ